eukprot:4715-Chlamydomonas_euryale.AAC.4
MPTESPICPPHPPACPLNPPYAHLIRLPSHTIPPAHLSKREEGCACNPAHHPMRALGLSSVEPCRGFDSPPFNACTRSQQCGAVSWV